MTTDWEGVISFGEAADWEVETIQKAQDRHGDKSFRLIVKPKNAKIAYRVDRNFTIVHILDGKYLYTGVAKRNPRDGLNPTIATNIAIYRAVVSYPVKI